jgi:hypothetical protein
MAAQEPILTYMDEKTGKPFAREEFANSLPTTSALEAQ